MNKKYYQKPNIRIVAIRQMSMICNSPLRGVKTYRNGSDDPDGWIWEGTLDDIDDDC